MSLAMFERIISSSYKTSLEQPYKITMRLSLITFPLALLEIGSMHTVRRKNSQKVTLHSRREIQLRSWHVAPARMVLRTDTRGDSNRKVKLNIIAYPGEIDLQAQRILHIQRHSQLHAIGLQLTQCHSHRCSFSAMRRMSGGMSTETRT